MRQEAPRVVAAPSDAWPTEPQRQDVAPPRDHIEPPSLDEIRPAAEAPRPAAAAPAPQRHEPSIEEEMSRLLDDLVEDENRKG